MPKGLELGLGQGQGQGLEVTEGLFHGKDLDRLRLRDLGRLGVLKALAEDWEC